MIFSIQQRFMQKNFTRRMIVYPAESAPTYVRFIIFVWITEDLYGEITARTVWPVSAVVQQKRSNMESTAKDCPAIIVKKKSKKKDCPVLGQSFFSKIDLLFL